LRGELEEEASVGLEIKERVGTLRIKLVGRGSNRDSPVGCPATGKVGDGEFVVAGSEVLVADGD